MALPSRCPPPVTSANLPASGLAIASLMEGRYIRRRMAPTYRDLLASTKKTIKEVTVDEVKKQLDSKAPVILLDVRETEEYGAGRLPGAISVPRGFLELRIEEK